ncbi:Bloom syndrome [Mycena venus]|uniref:DNA 3'-5' helicase n=1 Tax=Mycena venus TaxID=2733690 RepID=A0A8H6WSP6_9AGAR|nr:Bloom syndrome [Mycena venus]
MSNDKVDYYKVNLGSSAVDSSCPSPALQPSPILNAPGSTPPFSADSRSKGAQHAEGAERDCGIWYIVAVRLFPPRMASAPSAKPRPLRARIPESEASRAIHAISLVVLEPHCVRGLFIHAHHAPAPSVGPIVLGGKIRRTTRFPHSSALWVCTALGRVVRIAVRLLVGCWRAGGGKTIPFMMPLLLHRDKYSLVISPLKVLQEDQTKRFEKIGLKAAAVNGDTYSRDLQRELNGQTHSAILTSPEMCFEHQEFRKWLRDPVTGKRVLGPIIDEAHCASQWGGDFRPHYALLDRLRAVLPAGSLILTIVFTNAVKKTQIIKSHIRRLYPNVPARAFDFLHAHRTAKAKRRVMRDFRRGKIKILVATEAGGMGADIADVELIIQFGIPASLSIWTQRAGRAGRSPELQARAILLVEKSMFLRKKKRKKKSAGKSRVAAEPDSSILTPTLTTFHALDSEPEPQDGKEWAKNVDPVMHEYITTKLCRRDVADRYFQNPPRRREI